MFEFILTTKFNRPCDKDILDIGSSGYYEFILYGSEFFSKAKFVKDSIYEKNDEFDFFLDGVILNSKELKLDFPASTWFGTIVNLYKKYSNNFINELIGEFRGFLFDKKEKKLIVFTNQTSSKPIYYFIFKDDIIVSNSFFALVRFIKKNGYQINLDLNASYMLLSFGYLLDNYTLASEIKKLEAGNYLELSSYCLKIKNYHKFELKSVNLDPKDKIKKELDYLFRNSLRMEFEKDLEYGYEHITTLSGGLDSRIVSVLANELGYKSINLAMSIPGYLDEKISSKISRHLHCDYIFHSLENGNYLFNLDENVSSNGGLIGFAGSAHIRFVTSHIDFTKFGILHTGMLGDGILGSFLSKPVRIKPNNSIFPKKEITQKIYSIIQKSIANYESEEIFKLYQRGFNAVTNGFISTNDFCQISSPFMNKSFTEFCLQIPEKYKYQQRIYREWLFEKYPIIKRFIWERTGLPPSFPPWTRFISKTPKYIISKIRGNSRLNTSMNPEDYWLKTNNKLKAFFSDYYNDNLYHLEQFIELKKDSSNLYEHGGFRDKSYVLTLLAFLKYLNQDK